MEACPAAAAEAASLQVLYGERVIPPGLLLCLNNGFTLEHVVGEHEEAKCRADPAGFRAQTVGAVVDILRFVCLRVDDHPTLSRFFTFRQCVDAMLLLLLTGAPPHVFKLFKTQAREENKTRLTKVSIIVIIYSFVYYYSNL